MFLLTVIPRGPGPPLLATRGRAANYTRPKPERSALSRFLKKGTGSARPGGRAEAVPDVGQQGHEAGALDGVGDGALGGGAAAGALAAEQLAHAAAHLLEQPHVLVVHERGARAARLRAEPAAAPLGAPVLLPHRHPVPPIVGVEGEGPASGGTSRGARRRGP